MSRLVSPIVLMLLTMPAMAADWPSWRGPTADGIAPADARPPLTWDAATNIKWKAKLPGRGSATPIVVGDQIIVLTAAKTGKIALESERPKPDPRFQTRTTPPADVYRFEVISYDKSTGAIRWRRTATEAVPHEGHHETHSYAAGSPTTDGQRIYASFGSFGIYAFSLDGELLWKRDLGRLHTRLGWGEAVTPVVHKGHLILNWDQEGDGDSKLIVLDAATGATIWEANRDEKTSWNTPAVAEHNGVTQVIVNGTNRVRSYDLTDGKVLWSVAGMTTNAIPSPIVKDRIAYIMSGYRGSAAVAVPLEARGELAARNAVVWRFDKGTPYVPSPILVDGRLYFTAANTNVLSVLDAKVGKPLLTEERLAGLGQLYASPIFAAGRLYFVDRNGTTVVLKPGDEPEVLATNRLGEPVDASPVVSGPTLFLRGHEHLYAIEAK